VAELEVDQPAPGVTRLRLNRPERLNALTPPLLDELRATLERIDADESCRVVVVTGAGRGFCAGVDLGYVDDSAEDAKKNPARLMPGQAYWSSITPKLCSIRQPIIAAVNGPATGAGLALVLGSDIRLAGASASFAASFVRVGLSGADMGTSWLLPRIVGMARAQELLLTGRRFDATEALRIGLVVEMIPDDELEARSLQVAESVLANSPFGVTMTKEVMWASMEIAGLETAIKMETRTQALCACTDDHWEAANAFVEKRPPMFTGR
jgi:enoyl-CoA hydratase